MIPKSFVHIAGAVRSNMYYTYMLRCIDNSIYTGITTDLERRLCEHLAKNEKSAKYTRSHTAIEFEAVWKSNSKSNAQKLEYRIKRLKKAEKEKLITDNDFSLFGDKINSLEYERYNL